MWHKQSFTQFWSQSDAYSRRSSLKLTYIHHPLVVCTHQICCAVAVPIALSQDRLLHGHNRLVNWTPCSRMRESKLIKKDTSNIYRKHKQNEVIDEKATPCLLMDWCQNNGILFANNTLIPTIEVDRGLTSTRSMLKTPVIKNVILLGLKHKVLS